MQITNTSKSPQNLIDKVGTPQLFAPGQTRDDVELSDTELAGIESHPSFMIGTPPVMEDVSGKSEREVELEQEIKDLNADLADNNMAIEAGDALIKDLNAKVAELEKSLAEANAPKEYTIGELTSERVFKAAGLENVSDMQAVFDAVEAALTAPTPAEPESDDDATDERTDLKAKADELGIVYAKNIPTDKLRDLVSAKLDEQ